MPAKKSSRHPRDESVSLLEFIAGALALPRDAKEGQFVALAARVGLPTDAAARILGKSPGAATKAMQRARKK